jgi:hypothetical protein
MTQSLTTQFHTDSEYSTLLGTMTLSAKEIDLGQKEYLTLQLSCSGLEKRSLFSGKPDTFFIITRPPQQRFSTAEADAEDLQTALTTEERVYTSEIVPKSLTPCWNPFTLSIAELCQGDKERDLSLGVYSSKNGSLTDASKSHGSILNFSVDGTS